MEEFYNKNFEDLSNFELIKLFNEIVDNGRGWSNWQPIHRVEDLDYMLSDKSPLEIIDFARTNEWLDVNVDYYMADNYGRLFFL